VQILYCPGLSVQHGRKPAPSLHHDGADHEIQHRNR
jgi:hypothetical protein